MFKFKSYPIVVSAGALAMFALASTAQATPVSGQTTYVFDQDFCSTSCLNGASGGTITLSSPASNEVTVSVDLSSVNFHNNMGASFAFNLTGITGSVTSVDGITADTGMWSFNNESGGTISAGTIKEDGAGDFEYGLTCSNCAPSNGDVADQTLSFTISATGLDFDSFQQLSTKTSYFAATVFNPINGSCTGAIGASGASSGSTSTYLGGMTSTCTGAVPAPPIGQGLPVALAIGSLLLGFKLWERSQKHRSLGTVIPHAAA
jgi:hypothetical protein